MSKYIVKAKEYKVKDGDTLTSIAEANGITWQQLAKFNWGTTNLAKINKSLRSIVGCLKKDEKDKDYILSSADDPGIIYIPQDLILNTLASNETHKLTLKIPVKKKFTPANCFVNFRPFNTWNGEYGFDWMREGDFPIDIGGIKINNTLKFEDVIGNHKITTKAGKLINQPDGNTYKGDFYKDEKDYKKLQKEYKIKDIDFTKDDKGKRLKKYTSYLSIYIDDVDYKCPQEVVIQADIHVDSPPEELRFIYDKEVFEITPSVLPKSTQKIDVKIKCLKALKKDEEINVISIFRDENSIGHEIEVGHLIVMQNDKAKRKRVKTLLIAITSPALSPLGQRSGEFETNIPFIKRILRQALIDPIIEKATLDLTTDAVISQEFLDNYKNGINLFDKGAINKKYIHAYCFEQFMKSEKNKHKYDDYLIAFYMGEAHPNLYGYSLGHQVIMFSNALESTGVHEWLHSLSLPHTFTSSGKFTYKGTTTENIMDYTHHQYNPGDPATFHFKKSRISLYRWQWQQANKHSLNKIEK
jgi:hypothetical protein